MSAFNPAKQITLNDVEQIHGIQVSAASVRLSKARAYYGKPYPKHLSIREYCLYHSIDLQDVAQLLGFTFTHKSQKINS